MKLLPDHVHTWLSEPLPDDVESSLRRLAESEDVQHMAVMPDVHLSAEVCVGAVVATGELLYPAAVGGDIGCGIAAVRFEVGAEVLAQERWAERMLNALARQVPPNRHSSRTIGALPDALLSDPLSSPRLEKLKSRDGRVQLGTLGRGNHFLEFQSDDQERLWLMVHSGSRAMGQAITRHHLSVAADQTGAAPGNTAQPGSSPLLALDGAATAGQDYLHDLAWGRRYASHNRQRMVESVACLVRELFGADTDWSSLIESDHNHVRRESHFGREFWVHRKGAQLASDGEPGVIPGSMGTASFHVQGRGCPLSLTSSSHGAGRRLSRTEARRSITGRQLQKQLSGVWFDRRRAAALRDEAPLAYKDIRKVMRAQKSLTRITRELRPVLTYKGV